MAKVQIFTDGACRGNPGLGGWGAILRDQNGREKEISGFAEDTTNNRMEMTAAIAALNTLTQNCEVDIVTDSEYLRKGITEWVHQWQARDWRTSQKKPVKNKDLWIDLLEAEKRHTVRWHWVKGHSGHAENERADELANEAIDSMVRGSD
jgi:ribonuclease HI